MNILAAIKREERKLEKELGHLQKKLDGIRSAAKALGHDMSRGVVGLKRRVLSAAARARISAAQKARWAKASSKNKGGLTAAGRKRLSELMKKRWADRKKNASK